MRRALLLALIAFAVPAAGQNVTVVLPRPPSVRVVAPAPVVVVQPAPVVVVQQKGNRGKHKGQNK